MRLYLVQHAEANSKETDASRGLTDKGIADVRKVAEYAGRMNLSVVRIVHSGKNRAMQSARIMAEHIMVTKGVSESDGLAPMDDPDMWCARISETEDDIMLVGHLPYMARLSGLLICGSSEHHAVHFEMGCIVCLKKNDDESWSLEWMITPGMTV